jgi:hypothetical protein
MSKFFFVKSVKPRFYGQNKLLS